MPGGAISMMELGRMNVSDIRDELRAVEVALSNRPSPTITGGQLFALIDSAAPHLDIRAVVGIPKGPGALTEFVRQHMTGIVERVGNHGGDVLYLIGGRDLDNQAPFPSNDIWRTFVSPSSRMHLILNPSARRLMIRDTPASVADDEMGVAKASMDEHDKIRADFAASLSESEAAILRNRAGPDDDFESWIGALRELLPRGMAKWGQYRRNKLSDLFVARIRELGLDDSLEQAVLDQIRASENSAYVRPKAEKAAMVGQGSQNTIASGDSSDATALAR